MSLCNAALTAQETPRLRSSQPRVSGFWVPKELRIPSAMYDKYANTFAAYERHTGSRHLLDTWNYSSRRLTSRTVERRPRDWNATTGLYR
ncbi:hypothetical protein JVT61DRAFT_15020 [Boletus reticuloceps]|uniref:Uncharacterized protein n=1 Tax=Boletus reticuloceps TaxID=495285 RepID=A0A8I2YCH2_9AGAM|nr:hypothetical protein JVT61DRAFT_15020 [Boletus reticuloceps]